MATIVRLPYTMAIAPYFQGGLTTSYGTGGYANGRARFWWKCVGSAVQFLHPRIRPALTGTPGHGYCPFCPCWHPLVLSSGVDLSIRRTKSPKAEFPGGPEL